MTKTEARKLAKACRAAVDLHTVGHAMAGVLFALPAWQRADTVLAFASMPDEPDTADILRQALAESKRLLLPRVLSRTEMDWVEITALSQLQPGAYGILEAPASLPAFDTTHLGDGALALISLDGKMAVEITAASEHLSGVFCVAMHMNNDPVDHFCVLRVSTGYAKKRHLQRMQKK